MKTAILLTSVAIANAGLFEQCDTLFEKFQKDHKLNYGIVEGAKRQAYFCKNMQKADDLNAIQQKAGLPDAFGVTKFADRSDEEFKSVLGRKPDGKGPRDVPTRQPKVGTPPATVDWTAAGAVTPVKNQGQCGSCWAHSVTEQIESQWILDGNSMWEFSTQQVASCTTTCNGCGGGQTYDGYEYLMGLPTNEGLGSSAFAPYVQSMYTECTGTSCTEACSSIDVAALQTEEQLTGYYAQVTGYEYATTPCSSSDFKCNNQNLTELASNLATEGPASICVDASSWNLYTGNGAVVSQDTCQFGYFDLDHCVQLTGYDSTAPTPYWIVRNSWATDWGNNGYIYLEYPTNACGLADEATFVNLAAL